MKEATFTPRRPLDYYPTPANVTAVLRDWLRDQRGAPLATDRFLDPAAGDGMIVDAMRDVWGESFWHAIEINSAHCDALDGLCEDVTIADATSTAWPCAHVVANPPFALLDRFWCMASEHRAKHCVWVAMLTPVAWWNAESRRAHVRPDHILSLGWRPSFHRKDGPAHKGSQDFCWAVMSPVALPFCEWRRLEKPGALERAEAAARGVSVARLREVARERLARAVEAQGKDPL